MSNYLIKNYPNYYEYYKETEFTWDRTGGDPIKQGNRNPLLYKNIGVDGIKTGYLAYEFIRKISSLYTIHSYIFIKQWVSIALFNWVSTCSIPSKFSFFVIFIIIWVIFYQIIRHN